MLQYRITVEDRVFEPVNQYPGAKWSEMAALAESRGMNIKLESRSIYPKADDLLIACFANEDGSLPQGFMKIGEMLITSWEYEAAVITH